MFCFVLIVEQRARVSVFSRFSPLRKRLRDAVTTLGHLRGRMADNPDEIVLFHCVSGKFRSVVGASADDPASRVRVARFALRCCARARIVCA